MNLFAKLTESYDNKTNLDRLASRFHALSEIGATPDFGATRVAYSPEDRQAKELLKGWMREAGLRVREDAVGNVFGLLEGSRPELPIVLAGSHIDTVPNGGHFDGVAGVLTALEVAQRWKEQGYAPIRGLEIAAFADEEGSRFHASLTGSHFMMGELDLEAVKHYRDDNGLSFEEVLRADGLDAARAHEAARKPDELHGYVELHIEQGQVLEKRGLPVGIVNGIAGPAWLDMRWTGRASHAGTTPMGMRSDALAGAGEFVAVLDSLPEAFSPTAVATVGKFDVYPNGSNVIPGEVKLVVDVRDIDLGSRDRLIDEIVRVAQEIAARRGLQVSCDVNIKIDPTPMSPLLMACIRQAVEREGLPAFELTSGAGHDAMVIGRRVPTGMIFVRCLEGISHNPAEWASLSDLAVGLRVLDDTLKQLASSP